MFIPSILVLLAVSMVGRASAQSADDEQLFPWGAKITVHGVDSTKLTAAQAIYVEDAVGFAFNKVTANTDERAISSHLLNVGSDDDNTVVSSSNLRKWTDWHSMFFFAGGNGGCHFCGTSSLCS
jgi:hypothetical protein